jgi:hypothetical protein
MAKPKYCAHDECDVEFGLLKWRHKCVACKRTFCSKHCKEYRDQELAEGLGVGDGFCRECGPDFTAAVSASKKVETWSARYKGHVPYDRRRGSKVIRSGWNRDRDDSVKQLQVLAAYHGFSVVRGMAFTEGTDSEPSRSGRGVHYFTVWRARASASHRVKKTSR